MKMRVNIVCYEDLDTWILGKFARKMIENLQQMGIEVSVSKNADSSADINHHIIYLNWNCEKSSTDTLMITHIDNSEKLELLKKQMNVARMGVCMSREHRDFLVKMGIDPNKLCYINPAHDGKMPIKKIVIGWSNKVLPDGRKNEAYIDKLADVLDNTIFEFKIMGKNWGEKVELLRQKGFQVEYYDDFDYDKYLELVPSLDYYLYMGMDEGHMGVMDALAAGVKTIVTTQGYHLDIKNGITYGFKTLDELVEIFKNIQKDKLDLISGVSELTWRNYTLKHVELWEYLLSGKAPNSHFIDGYNSIAGLDANITNIEDIDADKAEKKLKIRLLKQQISSISYMRDIGWKLKLIRVYKIIKLKLMEVIYRV